MAIEFSTTVADVSVGYHPVRFTSEVADVVLVGVDTFASEVADVNVGP